MTRLGPSEARFEVCRRVVQNRTCVVARLARSVSVRLLTGAMLCDDEGLILPSLDVLCFPA